ILDIGLGTILVQKDNNKREYVVAYASKSLTHPEKNYSDTDSTEEVEVFYIITEDYFAKRIVKEDKNQYLENEQQRRKLVQQLNKKFYRRATWTYKWSITSQQKI
ncbi:28131_t:CDS:2, partial [Racocetra persica]